MHKPGTNRGIPSFHGEFVMSRFLLFPAILCAFLASACNYASVESASLVEKGIKQYEAKSLNKAMATFQTAIDRDSSNDKAHYYMALIDMNFRDYTAAIQKLDLAVGCAPDIPVYPYTLGLAYSEKAEELVANGSLDEAEAAYNSCVKSMKKAIALDPFYAEAQLQQARCHIGVKEYSEAVDAYEASIRSDPMLKTSKGTALHYKELGMLYARFGFFSLAVTVLSNGILNNVTDGSLEITVANVMFEMERYEEAFAHYNAANANLENKGESRIVALPALLGAAMSQYAIAKQMSKSDKQRNALDHFIEAKKWFDLYVQAAVNDEENIRRADAVARIKEIDEILSGEEI